MGGMEIATMPVNEAVKGAQRSSLTAELIFRVGRVKGESPSGVSTEKIVLVVTVFTYDVILMGVNIELQYNGVLNGIQQSWNVVFFYNVFCRVLYIPSYQETFTKCWLMFWQGS